MDYRAQLISVHSRANTNCIAAAIGNDPFAFKKIIDIIYNEKHPLPQRAAWLLTVIDDKHPALLTPYLSLFVNTLRQFQVDAIKRNMVVVLARHSIPEKLQGKLVDVCFDLMLSKTETVVVKTAAMQCIGNIAKKHPELISELKSIIEDQLPKTTAAFHSRAKRILKMLQ